MPDQTWFRRTAGGWEILVHAQPGASRSVVDGLHGDALKIRIQAPPVDGKANAALIAFLADRLGLAPRALSIASGETGRRKRVAVSDPDVDPAILLR